ncbi:hypothetical protein KUV85_00720 [Nocardioides panacisoli]|uniref:hypothetical protein n=1 Tax=Nocardioides panacisoli TaxID=627624 RepID=UPI001C625904|nr:hypothetical protein [Nocardioides panacisoli]QYJ04237.1 hypothetical protein KUV85_00720 [Nocardioides panacisoli]
MMEEARARHDAEAWFSGRDTDVLIYRLNRRPLTSDPQLFRRPPLLEHVEQVLAGGHTALTGRQFQRKWATGDRERGDDFMTGLLGWDRQGPEEPEHTYDETNDHWQTERRRRKTSAVAPFAVLVDGHYLGVMRHSSFTPQNVASAMESLLNFGESTRRIPTTEWAVEPVGDESQFLDWLGSLDRLTEVRFVFRQPNPDAEELFARLDQRITSMGADQIEQRITAKGEEASLDVEAVANDDTNRAFLAAAMAAFGYVLGRGYRHGKRATFNQKEAIARERVDPLSSDWQQARDAVLGALRRAAGRRQDRG